MMFLKIGILLTVATLGAMAGPHPAGSKFCVHCDGNKDPSLCTEVQKCHPDHTCFTDVVFYRGDYHYFKGCRPFHECDGNHVRVPHHLTNIYVLACEECCHTTDCNIHGCEQAIQMLQTTTTTPVPSTAAPTTAAATTTVAAPTLPQTTVSSCRDHEEDGMTCASMSHYNFCSATVHNTLAYELAHTKCPKFCGICDCKDHEAGGFRCADYDKFNFCTDTSSVAHDLAVKQCPKHCGLCGQQPVGVAAQAPVTLTSSVQSTAATKPSTTTAVPTIPVASVIIPQVITTAKPCVDREDATFSCASWASNGFCQSATGMLHDITVDRCSKYCGLC